MNECEKQLSICIDKHIASLDRESRHASAAATLDEGLTTCLERIEKALSRNKKFQSYTLKSLLFTLRGVYKLLQDTHDRAADVKSETIKDLIPLVRLGPGGDYIINIMEEDV
tara:strand:+ start:96 stop:431 length:336 start_codon:yes stop_codon:yes gene_type:complete